jgi:stage II sporulation protein D
MKVRGSRLFAELAMGLVMGVAVLLALGVPPASAQNHTERTLQQRVDLGHRPTVTIHGLGFGHGHGLSQYGAEGMAQHGWTAARILSHYYPHTLVGYSSTTVAVRISADTDGNTTVVDQPGLAIVDLATGEQWPTPTVGPGWGASEWRLGTAPLGGTLVSYLSDTWHVWKKIPGDAEFLRADGLTLDGDDGPVSYRGALQSRTYGGRRITVDVVDLESYVRSVVPSEMPAGWHPAALEAQAVAARSYASYEVAHSANPVFQLCDTAQCQVYGGMSAERYSSDEAAAATSGQVRTYAGSVALTQFSSSSGGWTRNGGLPYLVAERDPYDGWRGNAPHRWTVHVPSATIEARWPRLGRLRGVTIDRRDGNGTWGGRVLRLTLDGTKQDVAVGGETIRRVLGLRSSWLAFAR